MSLNLPNNFKSRVKIEPFTTLCLITKIFMKHHKTCNVFTMHFVCRRDTRFQPFGQSHVTPSVEKGWTRHIFIDFCSQSLFSGGLLSDLNASLLFVSFKELAPRCRLWFYSAQTQQDAAAHSSIAAQHIWLTHGRQGLGDLSLYICELWLNECTACGLGKPRF